jgi:hypothetical protein
MFSVPADTEWVRVQMRGLHSRGRFCLFVDGNRPWTLLLLSQQPKCQRVLPDCWHCIHVIVLLFARSVIYTAGSTVYSRATRTLDCQIKISRSRGSYHHRMRAQRSVIRVTGTFHHSFQPSSGTVRWWFPIRSSNALLIIFQPVKTFVTLTPPFLSPAFMNSEVHYYGLFTGLCP